ncbi:MAG: DUF61 family protein [Methanomicrobiales archaeon]|nr:DUF61 family protein [Methanomicrobiales archaeon]
MTSRPSVSDDSVLMRWMALEMGKVNDGVVARRRRLSELLTEARPSSVTRDGSEFTFDRGVIKMLGENLPRTIHPRLKLPVIFFFNSTVPDSCLLTDEVALEALQILGELSRFREFSGGKLWVGRAIVSPPGLAGEGPVRMGAWSWPERSGTGKEHLQQDKRGTGQGWNPEVAPDQGIRPGWEIRIIRFDGCP